MISFSRFLGDAERAFALTDDMVLELERIANAGIGLIYRRAIAQQFTIKDVTETIRLGLIGGGAGPQEAERLVSTWCRNRPIAETLPLALDILDARWSGVASLPDKTA